MSSSIDTTSLPLFLRERCNVYNSTASATNRQFILYISTNSLRSYENPALDVATQLSKQHQLPLVVHTFFDDNSLHATARRATFIIDSIRELEASYNAMGVDFTFQLMSDTSRQPAFLTLASRAAVVVTDEPFVEPYLTTVHRLKRVKSTPLITVDTSLEIPARLVSPKCVHRAFLYSSATKAQFAKRCQQPYPTTFTVSSPTTTTASSTTSLNLPTHLFLNLSQHPSTPELIKRCTSLDHAVLAVDHTRGGMKHALSRWSNFLNKGGMKNYHKTRNDPLQHHKYGVSRISAYLNVGILSPFKVARDALRMKSSKFMQEFEKVMLPGIPNLFFRQSVPNLLIY